MYIRGMVMYCVYLQYVGRYGRQTRGQPNVSLIFFSMITQICEEDLSRRACLVAWIMTARRSLVMPDVSLVALAGCQQRHQSQESKGFSSRLAR